MFLLQKKCYKFSSQIPASQGRKYLRSSSAVFNFPLFLAGGFRADFCFLIFPPMPLNGIRKLLIHTDNTHLFLFVRFILGK